MYIINIFAVPLSDQWQSASLAPPDKLNTVSMVFHKFKLKLNIQHAGERIRGLGASVAHAVHLCSERWYPQGLEGPQM